MNDLVPLFGLKALSELRIKRTRISWAQVGAVQKEIRGLRVIRSQ